MPSYSKYNSLCYNLGTCCQIWEANSLSTPIHNKGYNCGPKIFKALEMMRAKEKETTTKTIAKEKETNRKNYCKIRRFQFNWRSKCVELASSITVGCGWIPIVFKGPISQHINRWFPCIIYLDAIPYIQFLIISHILPSTCHNFLYFMQMVNNIWLNFLFLWHEFVLIWLVLHIPFSLYNQNLDILNIFLHFSCSIFET